MKKVLDLSIKHLSGGYNPNHTSANIRKEKNTNH